MQILHAGAAGICASRYYRINSPEVSRSSVGLLDSRPTLPVLANILLATEDGRLKLSATNLEMSITTYIGAKIDQPGSITLPAKTFAELVSNLSPERVDLTLDPPTQTVNVRCLMTNSNIKGISAGQFPPIPEPSDPDVVLPAKLIRDMINQTAFAAAKEDNRPILTGLVHPFRKWRYDLSIG